MSELKEICIQDAVNPPLTRKELKRLVRVLKSLCPIHAIDTDLKVNIIKREITVGNTVYWWE